ncbi:MAG: hypothetical protein RIR97_632 [Pseudomonadota bacterium]
MQSMGFNQETERRAFQRVTVNLPGRLMLSNFEEHDCFAIEMSPGDVFIQCSAPALDNERIIAYLEQVGRVEGKLQRNEQNGFVMSVTATDRKREKLAAQLTWLANKHELGLAEDRRYDRIIPKRSSTHIVLEDGTELPCVIVDLSLSCHWRTHATFRYPWSYRPAFP